MVLTLCIFARSARGSIVVKRTAAIGRYPAVARRSGEGPLTEPTADLPGRDVERQPMPLKSHSPRRQPTAMTREKGGSAREGACALQSLQRESCLNSDTGVVVAKQLTERIDPALHAGNLRPQPAKVPPH